MCIIVYKPIAVEFPATKIMRECFISNPDGAGVMFPHAGKVRFSKGFMKWKDFESYYEKLKRTVDINLPVAFHFRIGTHGIKKAPTHCHPFPITENYDSLTQLSGEFDIMGMHNGIISGFGNASYSDTMSFFALVLDAFPHESLLHDPVATKLIENLALPGNKILLMDGEGNVNQFGDFIEDKGIYYTNTSYKYTRYTSYTTSTTKEEIKKVYDVSKMRKLVSGETYWALLNPARLIHPKLSWNLYTDEYDVFSRDGLKMGELNWKDYTKLLPLLEDIDPLSEEDKEFLKNIEDAKGGEE